MPERGKNRVCEWCHHLNTTVQVANHTIWHCVPDLLIFRLLFFLLPDSASSSSDSLLSIVLAWFFSVLEKNTCHLTMMTAATLPVTITGFEWGVVDNGGKCYDAMSTSGRCMGRQAVTPFLPFLSLLLPSLLLCRKLTTVSCRQQATGKRAENWGNREQKTVKLAVRCISSYCQQPLALMESSTLQFMRRSFLSICQPARAVQQRVGWPLKVKVVTATTTVLEIE